MARRSSRTGWPALAKDTSWAKRIGIDGVALALVIQAVLALGLTLLVVVLYGGVSGLVIFNDPTIDAEARPFLLGGMVGALSCTAAMVAAFTAPYLIVAWGLRTRKPWSHLAGLIISGLSLSNFPLGVIAGILGFVVLLDKDITAELRGSATNTEGRDE